MWTKSSGKLELPSLIRLLRRESVFLNPFRKSFLVLSPKSQLRISNLAFRTYLPVQLVHERSTYFKGGRMASAHHQRCPCHPCHPRFNLWNLSFLRYSCSIRCIPSAIRFSQRTYLTRHIRLARLGGSDSLFSVSRDHSSSAKFGIRNYFSRSRLFTLVHAISRYFCGGGRGALDPGSLNSQPPTRVFTGTKTPARHT